MLSILNPIKHIEHWKYEYNDIIVINDSNYSINIKEYYDAIMGILDRNISLLNVNDSSITLENKVSTIINNINNETNSILEPLEVNLFNLNYHVSRIKINNFIYHYLFIRYIRDFFNFFEIDPYKIFKIGKMSLPNFDTIMAGNIQNQVKNLCDRIILKNNTPNLNIRKTIFKMILINISTIIPITEDGIIIPSMY